MATQEHTEVETRLTGSSGRGIVIKRARVHNLKNISVTIPHNKLVVITGVSGSGKSSLAYDTIYAEGQRRYVESLSSYARQFVGMMDKPAVDYIHGIAPAIAIEQSRAMAVRHSRSTVGTTTEIYDYLKLLFARTGKTFSPVSGKMVRKHAVADVVNYIRSLPEGTSVTLCSPIQAEKNLIQQLHDLSKQGFSRVEINGEIKKIEEMIEYEKSEVRSQKKEKHQTSNIKHQTFFLVIDRFSVEKENEESRIADSVQTAFYEGKGEMQVKSQKSKVKSEIQTATFSSRFELDGIVFEEPSVHLFSFNNPVGACKTCNGFGNVIGFDENLIFPNQNLSVYDDAVACWRGEKMSQWKNTLLKNAHRFDFPVHRPYFQLTEEEKKLLWTGNEFFHGLNDFFRYVEAESYKIQYRVMLARYRGKTQCPECRGSRLRKEANYVKISGKSIRDIVSMEAKDALKFLQTLPLENHEKQIAQRLLTEIISRLQFLCNLGLGYLTLNRLSNTLSGGEAQRIHLAKSLGSALVGSLYILDEPSIGLHPRDTQRLIQSLKELRDIGNTVIVVEHDESIIRAADLIIDLGPEAGADGGEIVFQGNPQEVKSQKHAQSDSEGSEVKSYTIKYLNGEEKIELPETRRSWRNYIEVIGARENNLKNLNVKFPLGVLTVVTGVSGSGKSSLVRNVLYARLKKVLTEIQSSDPDSHRDRVQNSKLETQNSQLLGGDVHKISDVEMVDRNPLGKSSRSNPITYIKGYDEIRSLFASHHQAKIRGYKPSTFSFNVEGGRCEECQGEGEITVPMQFMADVHLICPSCKGKRFKDDVLEILFNEKNIADVLNMTVDEAIEFFSIPHIPLTEGDKRGGIDGNMAEWKTKGKQERIKYERWHTQRLCSHITGKLRVLQEVGMGYVKLGQSSDTLSGGEAQRIKLATFLTGQGTKGKGRGTNVLFIFDEPTTGLHFHDIKKLLFALNRLIDEGNTVLVIEHHPAVIHSADHIIDLGTEGGVQGGQVLFEGTPEELVKCEKSITGKFMSGFF